MQKRKTLSLPIAIALLILLVGFFSLISHWPYGREIYFIGLLSIGVLYFNRYVNKSFKSTKDKVKLLTVQYWVIVMSLGVFGFHLEPYVFNILWALGLYWLILEIIDLIKPKENNIPMNPVLWIGLLLMGCLVLVKILHLPYGSIIFIWGTLITSIGFIVDHYLGIKREEAEEKD